MSGSGRIPRSSRRRDRLKCIRTLAYRLWAGIRKENLQRLDRSGAAHGRAVHQPAQRQIVIEICLMLSRAVVPHDQVARLPVVLVPELRPDDVRAKLCEQRIALGLWQADDMRGMGLVDEQGLAAGHRMSA